MTEKYDSSLWSAFALGLGVAIGNGFARFAYALLLPAMREQLHWSYSEAGWMNTANALGYIIGATSGFWLLSKTNPVKIFSYGIWLTIASVTLTAFNSHIAWLTSARLCSGVGAAWIFSCGGALVSLHYQSKPNLLGTATGVYFGGAGIGIVSSGILINPLMAEYGSTHWQIAWLLLGLASLILAAWPLKIAKSMDSLSTRSKGIAPNWHGLIPSLIAYFLFACGYIVYMTFIFAWLRNEGVSWRISTWIWATLGFSVSASPFVWRSALTSWNPIVVLSASCLVTLVGTLIPIYYNSNLALFASATIFGLGVFIAPSAVTVLSRKVMASSQIAMAITLYTIVFSTGQAIGPVLAGWIADQRDLRIALAFGALLLFVAALTALIGISEVKKRIAPIQSSQVS